MQVQTSAKQMKQGQVQRLRQLVEYAQTHVPHYRELFKEVGFSAGDFTSTDDLLRLPLLSKKTVQECWPSFLSDEFDESELIIRYTSGSTGEPMKCAMTAEERIVAGRHMMRARRAWGLPVPARWAILGGAINFVAGDLEKIIQESQRGQEILRLPSLDLSAGAIEQYLAALQSFQPQWIYGLPSAVGRMAEYALEHSISLNMPHLVLIEMAGEFLSPENRSRIFTAFGKHPASQYACREFWGIAFECPYRYMHEFTEHVYVEIVGKDGARVSPGEVGEVVITGLNNRAQPLIRYRTGDLARELTNSCPCGNLRATIELTGGRMTDTIVGTDGMIGSLVFDSVVKILYQRGIDGIAQYCVVQRGVGRFDVLMVPNSRWTEHDREAFDAQARRILGKDIVLNFRLVESIPPLPSGKVRSFFVQED